MAVMRKWKCKCGHEWEVRDMPFTCPSCGVGGSHLKCDLCNTEWDSSSKNEKCPNCEGNYHMSLGYENVKQISKNIECTGEWGSGEY